VGLTVDTVRRLIDSYEKRFARRIFFVNALGQMTLASHSLDHLRLGIGELPGLRDIAAEILQPNTQPRQLRYELEGSVALVNSRFIPEFGWYLVVEQTEDPSLLPLRRVLYGNLAVSLLVTLVVLLIVRYTVGFFQARLEKMATTDKLTGLLNRGALEIIFAQQTRDLARNPGALSAIMLDIDLFKSVNDTHGHLAGDRVLQQVVAVARRGLRASDALARWGGEEFLALLKDCTLADAVGVAEKIRQEVAASSFLPDYDQPLTISLGVAQLAPNETMDELLHRVDQALYRAKQQGRDRVSVG
jgi:diguanylate cyclase (GGDEF)-like protein